MVTYSSMKMKDLAPDLGGERVTGNQDYRKPREPVWDSGDTTQTPAGGGVREVLWADVTNSKRCSQLKSTGRKLLRPLWVLPAAGLGEIGEEKER